MTGVFEALADPVRRTILEHLAPGEQPAGAVVAAVQATRAVSQPAVSQHLKVLREAGLVTVRAEGTRRWYGVDAGGIGRARAWLDRVVDPAAPFAQPLDALATEVARGRRARPDRRAGGSGSPLTAFTPGMREEAAE